MKKILALLLLSMILAMPVVADTASTGVSETDTTADNSVVLNSDDAASAQNAADGTDSAYADNAKRKRIAAAKRLATAKTDVADAKATYMEKRKRYLAIKAKVLRLRETTKEKKEELLSIKHRLKNASDEDKEKVRKELKEKATESLKKFIESALTKIEALEEKGITSDKLTTIKNEFLALQEQLETGDVSREDVISVHKSFKRLYSSLFNEARMKAGNSLQNKIEAYLKKADTAYERTSALIEKFEKKGVDVTEMKTALESYNSKVEKAKVLFEEAKANWEAAETAEDKRTALKEAQFKVKEIHKLLTEAFHELKEAIHGLKQAARTSSEENNVETGEA